MSVFLKKHFLCFFILFSLGVLCLFFQKFLFFFANFAHVAEISWWSGHKLCNAIAEVCLVSSVVLLSCFQPVRYSSLVPVAFSLFVLPEHVHMHVCNRS